MGQNFLVDRSVARRIAELTDPDLPRVLEIGPGRGALTEFLLERHDRVLAWELDAVLANELTGRLAGRGLELRHADAVREDLGQLAAEVPWQVASNLPYSVGTVIVRRLMVRVDLFSRLVVMLQQEVVDRLLARPAAKGHGIMALEREAFAEAELAFRVAPGAFRPRPRVTSAVVVVTPRRPTRSVEDIRAALNLASDLLTRPRKTLLNAGRGRLEAGDYERAGIDPGRRPGTLGLEEWLALAAQLRPR